MRRSPVGADGRDRLKVLSQYFIILMHIAIWHQTSFLNLHRALKAVCSECSRYGKLVTSVCKILVHLSIDFKCMFRLNQMLFIV